MYMLRDAFSGARSRKSMNAVRPSAKRASRKPPPPRLPAEGCVTASAKPTATAASIALPPASSTATPTSVACASRVATMPCRARTGWRAYNPAPAAAINATSNAIFRISFDSTSGPARCGSARSLHVLRA